jgi:hypothetical protein
MNGLNLHRNPKASSVQWVLGSWDSGRILWLAVASSLCFEGSYGGLTNKCHVGVLDGSVGVGVNLKVNDCLSAASCYERLQFTPEPKSWHRATGFG